MSNSHIDNFTPKLRRIQQAEEPCVYLTLTPRLPTLESPFTKVGRRVCFHVLRVIALNNSQVRLTKFLQDSSHQQLLFSCLA